jgi:hypothetical protein
MGDTGASSSQEASCKRARVSDQAQAEHTGRIFLASPELANLLGKKFCDETELLPLLFARGSIRRVRTIEVTVQPLGGDSFKIELDASRPSVGEAKVEITRVQGTLEVQQELYRVATRDDGGAVREDDMEPEPLEDESMMLEEGEMVAMAVKDLPLLWQTCATQYVTLSEGGAVATQTADSVSDVIRDWGGSDDDDDDGVFSLVTSGWDINAGRHYWEVELLSTQHRDITRVFVGVTRPKLEPVGNYTGRNCTDSWFITNGSGSLCGNGKAWDDLSGGYMQGERVGVLLDLDVGSLLFFKNGVQNGPGFPAGSLKGPVVAAVQMMELGQAVRIHAGVDFPAGHTQ